MTRAELQKHILDTYGVAPDHPWARDPESAVFRHAGNRKWFALIMRIPAKRLGLPGGETERGGKAECGGYVDIVNLKCDGRIIGSLRGEPGFFPAYHMSKTSWLTAALDGSADDEKLKLLLGMSFDATAPKMRPRRK